MYKYLKMSALIQIISVTTYSLSISIVVLSMKKKYNLQNFASRGFLTLLWFLWTANTNYFDSIRMELLPLIIVIPLRIISPLLYVLQKIAISRGNSQSALITLGTLGRLSTVWFGVGKRVKMWPWTTMALKSVTPQPLPNYLITIFQILPPILIAIFLIQILFHCIS